MSTKTVRLTINKCIWITLRNFSNVDRKFNNQTISSNSFTRKTSLYINQFRYAVILNFYRKHKLFLNDKINLNTFSIQFSKYQAPLARAVHYRFIYRPIKVNFSHCRAHTSMFSFQSDFAQWDETAKIRGIVQNFKKKKMTQKIRWPHSIHSRVYEKLATGTKIHLLQWTCPFLEFCLILTLWHIV